MIKLYSYYQSSASYRVRIALGLKGLEVEMQYVNLVKGEQREGAYEAVNPQMIVPTIVHKGRVFTQSLAIMEYLDEAFPNWPLLPKEPMERARVRALAEAIACDISPLGNLKVRTHLFRQFNLDKDAQFAWTRHWIDDGLPAIEKLLALSPMTGTFCHGEEPGLADCCLVPQWFNAERFECNLSAYPTIKRIVDACNQHPAFIAAHPNRQEDAPKA